MTNGTKLIENGDILILTIKLSLDLINVIEKYIYKI